MTNFSIPFLLQLLFSIASKMFGSDQEMKNNNLGAKSLKPKQYI